MQIHLSAMTVSSRMEYRAILLSLSYASSIFPAHSCRIACNTRIYSAAMRRSRVMLALDHARFVMIRVLWFRQKKSLR